jgi:hypothetical protein
LNGRRQKEIDQAIEDSNCGKYIEDEDGNIFPLHDENVHGCNEEQNLFHINLEQSGGRKS